MRKSVTTALLAACMAVGAAALGLSAAAAEVTLKLHHFLPTTSITHEDFLVPWAERVEAASGGRIDIQIYPAMQLGGRAPQLYDQVRDGVVDMAWTLPSYTPGRFPITRVFQLPFMVSNAEATSQAIEVFAERHLRDEFGDVKPLLFHVHDRGVLHMKDRPVRRMEDLEGAKIRAPGRAIGDALEALGATPVFMPVPQVPEALSRGVIDGAAIPYEVMLALRVHEIADSHTEVKGPRGLYTAVFLFAMNRERYESLPEDLRRIIDEHTGLALARRAGRLWDAEEARARAAARAEGNAIHAIDGAEAERWKQTTGPVIEAWVRDMDEQGLDGRALLE